MYIFLYISICCRFNIYTKKTEVVFLGRQTINGNRCLLCQQMCSFMSPINKHRWASPFCLFNPFSL